MNQSLISWPTIVLAGLALVVAMHMYMKRVAEMRERRVHPQWLATRQVAEKQLHNTQASDNVTPLQLSLAWQLARAN